jgi:hypothetical protein
VTTEWRERSHAWHMAERFLHGYPKEGKWHRPPFEVVSAYVDQTTLPLTRTGIAWLSTFCLCCGFRRAFS